MDNAGRTSPRLAVWLTSLLLPPHAQEIVTGDLNEAFQADAARLGLSAARRRYWRLAFQSVVAYWWPARRADSRAMPSHRGRIGASLPGLMRDLRLGLRHARHRPGFSFSVAATLAVGVAATTIVFGLVSALTVHPLAYADADRVTFLLGWDTRNDEMRFQMRYADVVDITDRTNVFESVAVYRFWNANLQGDGLPERATAYRVSGNTFEVLGTPAALGRTFTEADLVDGNDRMAVLSHGLWARRYGADPDIVGREIVINTERYTVLGVMPAAFEFPIYNFKGDLWTPLVITPEWTPGARDRSPTVVAIGRLAPNVPLDKAQTAAATVMAQIADASPRTNSDRGVRVTPMGALGADQLAPAFAAMAVAVGLVLLVACANAANLQLARGVTRGREMAMRAALGASRLQLIRQLLAESAVLALTGGLLGSAIAWVALGAIRNTMPDFIVRVLPGVDAIHLNATVLAVALLTSVGTVFLFGLMPAWRTVRLALTEALKSGSHGVTESHRQWLRSGLIIGQVALSVALLVATGLLARSVHNLTTADPGFAKDKLLTFSASLSSAGYGEAGDRLRYFNEMLDRIGALPGVAQVGMVNTLPFSTSNDTTPLSIQGVPVDNTEAPRAGFRLVNDQYFDTLGMSVREGRGLRSSDGTAASNAVVVNEAFVHRYLGALPPVGRTLQLGAQDSNSSPADLMTIVGVVSDVQHWVLSSAPEPEVYVHYSYAPRLTMSFAVRTLGDPMAMLPSVRAAAAALDPSVPLYDAASMRDLVDNSFLAQNLTSSALVVFGLSTLVLTSLGLHGLLAFSVGARSKEIGVRMALGASGQTVMALVLRDSLYLTGVGTLVGVGLAVALSRGLESLLFGVTSSDPISYAGAAGVIVLVALTASWLPARRALRVDPIATLRG